MCIRSNLSFVLIHERQFLKIYGVFHFSDIQYYVIFFPVKMAYFWTFILQFKSLPAKKPWHVIYCCIRNFKQIINIKLSLTRNDIANFDYALALKKTLGMSFVLYAPCTSYTSCCSTKTSPYWVCFIHHLTRRFNYLMFIITYQNFSDFCLWSVYVTVASQLERGGGRGQDLPKIESLGCFEISCQKGGINLKRVGWGGVGWGFDVEMGGLSLFFITLQFNHIYSVCWKIKVSFITSRFSSKSSQYQNIISYVYF